MSSATTAPTSSDLLDENETAVFLRSNARTLQRWRTSGVGPSFVKIGHRVFYTRGELKAYKIRQTRQHTQERPAVEAGA